MIYVGTDIIKISRIEKIITEKGQQFLSHIFTPIEQSTCNSKSSPHIHYGGKFAAKEAVKKAILSSNQKKNILLNTIEIQNKDDGAPVAILKEDLLGKVNIQISISHTEEYATAVAILEFK